MKSINEVYTVNSIDENHSVVSKNEEIHTLQSREVVNLTINYTQAVFEYVPPPPTRDSQGIPGQQSFDDDYHYICVAPNRWARTILTKGW